MTSTSRSAPHAHAFTTSRRSLLGAIPAAAVAVAIPASALAATGSAADTSEWENALAAFRGVERSFDHLCGRWEQAEEALSDAAPARIDHYFDRYQLGFGMDRQQVEYRLRFYANFTGEQIDIPRIADEFEAYERRVMAVRERFPTDEAYEAIREYEPTFQEARDALMAVPAPTTGALLVKIEMAAMSLDDEHAESVVADARRLLGEARHG